MSVGGFDLAAVIAVIADAVESRLRAEANPLMADPVFEQELRGQIVRIVHRVLADVGVVERQPEPLADGSAAPIGARRAQQGIHPSASLAAADALFDAALPELVRAVPAAEQSEIARRLNAEIRSEVTKASTDYVDELVARLRPDAAPVRAPESVRRLTTRELEVLRLIAEGHSNQRIAGELSIAEGTVKRHAGAIYDKLEARSRVDAVRIAAAAGLL